MTPLRKWLLAAHLLLLVPAVALWKGRGLSWWGFVFFFLLPEGTPQRR